MAAGYGLLAALPSSLTLVVLGKFLVLSFLFYMLCDTTVIEPWLCCSPAIEPMNYISSYGDDGGHLPSHDTILYFVVD